MGGGGEGELLPSIGLLGMGVAGLGCIFTTQLTIMGSSFQAFLIVTRMGSKFLGASRVRKLFAQSD